MDDEYAVKPPYGRRSILGIIEGRALHEPARPWLHVPRSSNPKDGWKPITYAEGINAIDRAAHKVTENVGEPPRDAFPTVAYIGPSDVRYIIFAFGMVKAGYKALFISPRNSHEGQMSLFEETACIAVMFDQDYHNLVRPWVRERDMRAIMVAPACRWFPEKRWPHFPYNKTYDEAAWDPLAVLHTSGSTGIPKAIVARQGMLSISDAYHNLPEWHGTHVCQGAWAAMSSLWFIPMPLFHAAGLYMSIMEPLFWDSPVALPIPDKPLTSDMVVECIDNVEPDATLLPPVILEEISQSTEHMKALAKLNVVAFGGGNLAEQAGNTLVAHGVRLENVLSTTEFTPYPLYWQPSRKMWQWFIINSNVFGCDWRPTTDESDVYELVIVRKGIDPGMQGFFYTFPDATEFWTRDLFRKHPQLPDHWRYEGRADDIIVLSNGEKLNPVTIEHTVMGHPEVRGALVVGANRFQPALILEPRVYPSTKQQKKEFIDSVWPTVAKVNKATVAHGQISRQFIAISMPGKPFKRAGKGTIQRSTTIRMYEGYIDEIYNNADRVAISDAVKLEFHTEDALIRSVMDVLRAAAVTVPLDPDIDLFQSGIDSMHVINTSRMLRASLESTGIYVSPDALATRVIYTHPTPRKLARYLFSLVKCEKDAMAYGAADEEVAMRRQIERYTQDLPERRGDKAMPSDENQTVLLTGSTGALGSYLLDFIRAEPGVRRVICLNRSENGRERQMRVSAVRGLSTDFHKVEFLHADLGQDKLGLNDEADYDRLQNEVDRVIHSQWPVNFNIAIESFEPHVRGVRRLIDFSSGARKAVPITFISSVGTLDRWKEPHAVPERQLDDLSLPSTGYGRSKLVSSLILDKATEVSGVPSEVIRVGQIAGPLGEKGAWNRQEWLPSIIASSLYLGALPGDLGIRDTVDWQPIESMARTILEVAGVTEKLALEDVHGYFHGVNPRKTTWGALAPAVKAFYQGRIKRLLPFGHWIKLLEGSQMATGDVSKNPAIKLLDTYRSWSVQDGQDVTHLDMETTRTERYSRTTRELEAISPELMVHWCRQWGL